MQFKITGIKIPKHKKSLNKEIVDAGVPDIVSIPINSHKGEAATAVVKVDDYVKVGTLIAKATGEISANVYSSVSGIVKDVVAGNIITIKSMADEFEKSIDISTDIVKETDLGSSQLLNKISDMGIIGMGGAGFPTGLKLSLATKNKIDCIIVNGMEGEPYFTADNRLMIEKAEEIIIGTRIINKIFSIQNAVIAVDAAHKGVVDALSSKTKLYVGVNVSPLKSIYPLGAEKQLVKSITGQEIGSGKHPYDYGVMVINVGTVFAIYEAVMKNKPLFQRIVTVSGEGVDSPQNFLVRAGTPVAHLIKKAQIDASKVKMVIRGGLMTGKTFEKLDFSTNNICAGVLFFNNIPARGIETPCIRCGKCVDKCPMNLQPFAIASAVKDMDIPMMYKLRAFDCIECGICSYLCPAKISLLDYVKSAKKEVK